MVGVVSISVWEVLRACGREREGDRETSRDTTDEVRAPLLQRARRKTSRDTTLLSSQLRASLSVKVCSSRSLKTQARLARPQGVTSIVHILSLYACSLAMALHDCLLSACTSHALMHVYMMYTCSYIPIQVSKVIAINTQNR